MANNSEQLFGDYTPIMMPKFTTLPLEGLRQLSANTAYASGCDNNKCQKYDSKAVQKAVENAQVTFVCLGTGEDSVCHRLTD